MVPSAAKNYFIDLPESSKKKKYINFFLFLFLFLLKFRLFISLQNKRNTRKF